MSDSYTLVLDKMSSQCGNNIYLETAINNVALIFSDNLSMGQIKAIFTTEAAANTVYEEFMKQIKKKVISSFGLVGAAIDLAQSAGTAVANSWFGTEDMINDYYQMNALYEIEDLVRTSVLNTSGSTFCFAFKMYENICLMGCDYSKKYVEPLYTSLFGKLFAWATNQNYENYSAQLDDLKEQLSFMFEMIDVGADSWYVIDTDNVENMNVVNGNFKIKQYSEDEYLEQNDNVAMDVFSTYGCNNGSNITLNRDLVIYNDFKITWGTINLNGHTLTVCGNATQSGGTVIIDKGNLSVNGNLQQTSGTMYIDGGTLVVDENYYIAGGTFNSPSESHGRLVMTNDDDKVYVNGDFCTYSDYAHGSCLTAGTMYLRGNFSQRCYYDYTYHGIEYNFDCKGNHKVVFDGTGKQSIYFRNSGFSGFAYAEFVNNSNIVFSSSIRGWKLPKDTILEQDLRINVSFQSTIDMNGYDLTILGDLYLGDGNINQNGGNLTVLGNTIIDYGSIDISGGTMKTKNLQQKGNGEININGGTLEVDGNYLIGSGTIDQPGGYCYHILKMTNENDKVYVNGYFYTYSVRDHTTYLTAGTMYIKGNFTEHYVDDYYKNFNASGTHKVVFNGTGKQTVLFSSSNSHFNILQLTKPKENYTFKPNNCWNELILTTKQDYTDNDSGITVTTHIDGGLSVENITDEDVINQINSTLVSNEELKSIVEINLTNNGNVIQPSETVTVKIPTSNEIATVYRVETDGSLTNMNATIDNGYLVFNADKLGQFVLAVEKSELVIPGDVNGDGDVSIIDATAIQKYLVQLVSFNDEQLKVADTNSDGWVDITDATRIQKYLVGLVPSLG